MIHSGNIHSRNIADPVFRRNHKVDTSHRLFTTEALSVSRRNHKVDLILMIEALAVRSQVQAWPLNQDSNKVTSEFAIQVSKFESKWDVSTK